MEASYAGIETAGNPRASHCARPHEGDALETGADIRDDAPEDESRRRSARASQRITALGEMTRGIAHDFRNILALIESGVRLAEDNLGNAGRSRACLAAAHQGVARGLALTSQLLAFATPQKPDVHPEDANRLIRELAPFLKYGAGPGIDVRLDLADDIPICPIEPSQFNAAILNLVVNARDAMSGGGTILISTERFDLGPSRRRSSWLRLGVSDNGEGMSPETVRRIFDPFFTTKGNTGTGLGVPQVHAFMQGLGGQVRVASRPGTGTRFDLLFPPVSQSGPLREDLRRQIDRWVNEGGAVRHAASGDGAHGRAGP